MRDVRELRWLDLDPATHAFDPQVVRPALERIVTTPGGGNARRTLVVRDFDAAITAAYGPWAAGWTWTANEPGGGGPVHGWCCERDSVLRDEDGSPLDTVDRALGALASWRGYLDELSARFAALYADTRELVLEAAIERAAARLLPYVIERTNAEDAWYGTFAATLEWFAEPLVPDVDEMRGVVDKLIRGRFESWMTPADDVATAACVDLGVAIAAPGTRDALAAWLAIRDSAFVAPAAALHSPVDGDAHQRYIDRVDRARDPQRAERMSAALEMCRASATSGLGVSLDQLSEWQAIVLGAPEPVPLRAGDAFGKRGRERYPRIPDLHDLLESALADANDGRTHVAIRAARIYLDICFFHPFADGNARAARLALDHVLTASGFALRAAEPVFAISRAASDADSAASLAAMLDRLIGPRASS